MYAKYWQSLTSEQKEELAQTVDTTTGYLRHVMHGRKKAGFKLAQDLHKATNGKVNKSVLRPDIYPNTLDD